MLRESNYRSPRNQDLSHESREASTVLGFGIRWNDEESVPLSEIFPLLAIDLEQRLTNQGEFDLAAQLSCWRWSGRRSGNLAGFQEGRSVN